MTAGGNFFFYPINLTNPEEVVQASAYWIACWDELKSAYLTIDEMIENEARRYFYLDENFNFYLQYMKTHKQLKDYTTTFTDANNKINSAVFTEMEKQKRAPGPIVDSMEYEINASIADFMGY